MLYNTFLLLTPSLRNMMLRYTEPEFVNLLLSAGIVQPVGLDSRAPSNALSSAMDLNFDRFFSDNIFPGMKVIATV